MTCEVRRKWQQKSMCLNSLASKPTCHWLNSEIGWDIRSDIFLFYYFDFVCVCVCGCFDLFFFFRISFSTCREKKSKILSWACTEGNVLYWKEFEIVNSVCPSLYWGFILFYINILVVKRGPHTSVGSRVLKNINWK